MTTPRSSRTGKSLQLAATIDRPLIWRKGDSVRFLVVDVTAPEVEAKRAPKVPLNLALVIDASGSMQGRPIEAAKESARRLAAELGGDDILSVVSFDTSVAVHVDRQRQDAKGQARAAAAIGSLEAGSSTDLGSGWLKGCACVAKAMEKEAGERNLRNRVVLLSDGQANVGIIEPDELSRHASELRARGLLSTAVGIGEGWSDRQLGAIAASGGGRLHHAADVDEIVELVLGELDELRSTVVESCDLVVELPAGFRGEVVGDYATKRLGHRISCVLGSLASGAKRTVVFKVTCPKGEIGDTAELRVLAHWRRVGEEEAIETPRLECAFEFASSNAAKEQDRDDDLALRVARAWQLTIVHAATRLNQDGDLFRAGRFVQKEIGFFERYCKALPGAEELLLPLRRMAASVGEVQYSAMPAKAMMVATMKSRRGERELRESASIEWSHYMPEIKEN